MAEPLYKSSDVPDFSTYPASPEDQSPTRANASLSPGLRKGERNGNAQLNERARQVGTIVGEAVNMVRRAQPPLELVKDRARDGVSGIADLRSRASEQIDHLTARASDQVENVKNQATEQLDQLRARAQQVMDEAQAKIGPAVDRAWDQAQAGFDKARSSARRARHEYPVQVILAAGVIGFIAGAVLRARRGNA